MLCALLKAGLDKYPFTDSVPDKNNTGLGKNLRNTTAAAVTDLDKGTLAEFV